MARTATKRRRSDSVKTTATRARKPTATQQYLDEDMAPKRIDAIERKGAELIEAKDMRARYLEEANAASEALIAIMLDEGVSEYTIEVGDRRYKLTLDKETKLSAKRLKLTPEE